MVDEPISLIVHGVSHTHARWLLDWRTPDAFRVVGVVEPDAGLRERFARAFGLSSRAAVVRFADLPDTGAEAVAGFGSVSDHVTVAADGASAGLPVMLEKPLATNAVDAQRVAALAAEHGIAVLTHYETDAYPSLAALAQRLASGDIGAPVRIVAAHGHPGPVERGVNAECLAWLCDPARDGGAITDFGCYGIAQTVWLMDGRLPDRVTAHGWTRKPDRYPGVEDDATIVLEYPGLSAVIQPSWCWPYDRKAVTVFGTEGALEAPGPAVLMHRDATGGARELACPELPPARRDPFRRLTAVVRGGETITAHHPTHLDNAVATARLLEAARYSARQGVTVTL